MPLMTSKRLYGSDDQQVFFFLTLICSMKREGRNVKSATFSSNLFCCTQRLKSRHVLLTCNFSRENEEVPYKEKQYVTVKQANRLFSPSW